MISCRLLRWGWLGGFIALLVSVSPGVGAVPFQVDGVLAGSPGDAVILALVDQGVVDLEAATVRISFDPLILSLTGVTNGDVTSGFSLTVGLPSGGSPNEVLVSLSSLLGPVTGISGSLLVAHFDIRASAPLGQTSVLFQSADTDYDIPATFGTVTVAGAAAPEAGSAPLLALGLTCLIAASGRRRAATGRAS